MQTIANDLNTSPLVGGPRRVTTLTALTLLAGLASTIFAPLTAALVENSDWRRTYLVLAVILAAVTIPGSP